MIVKDRNCYCGGRLQTVDTKLFEDEGLTAKCQDCRRIWREHIVEDGGRIWMLLIRWSDFAGPSKEVKNHPSRPRGEQVEVVWNCQRCGWNKCKNNPKTFRVTCDNCGFVYYAEREGKAPRIHHLEESKKRFIKELLDAEPNSKEENVVMVGLQQIKIELAAIHTEEL